jgi:hypothetical protein
VSRRGSKEKSNAQDALFNKYDLFHAVLDSDRSAPDKALLFSLILHANVTTGNAWPSVERLCRARGINNEKNFKGVEHYLPGLVTVTRRGRLGNLYTINADAIADLPQAAVTLKHTPWPPPPETATVLLGQPKSMPGQRKSLVQQGPIVQNKIENIVQDKVQR